MMVQDKLEAARVALVKKHILVKRKRRKAAAVTARGSLELHKQSPDTGLAPCGAGAKLAGDRSAC